MVKDEGGFLKDTLKVYWFVFFYKRLFFLIYFWVWVDGESLLLGN
jgi:hypothetical protein